MEECESKILVFAVSRYGRIGPTKGGLSKMMTMGSMTARILSVHEEERFRFSLMLLFIAKYSMKGFSSHCGNAKLKWEIS